MTETKYIDQQEYDKLYEAIDDLHINMQVWAIKLCEVGSHLSNDHQLAGMFDLGKVYAEMKCKAKEIGEKYLLVKESEDEEE